MSGCIDAFVMGLPIRAMIFVEFLVILGGGAMVEWVN